MKTTVKPPANKREAKKRVNIPWNSRLIFQLGIIVSCLVVFFVMQTSFQIEETSYNDRTEFGILEPPMITYEVDVDIPQPNAPIPKEVVKPVTTIKPVISDVFEVKENTSKDEETTVPPTDIPIIETPLPVIPKPIDPEPTGPTSIINVEFVPVYPGCESLATNSEKIDCLSSEINIFINRNFRKEILESLEANQVHKIYVQFKIDTNGYIKDVRANAINDKLKREAQRVISNLPKMKPGRQGDKNVDVLYTVPIVFKIQ